MKNGEIYTKEYNDGDRCVFKYKAPAERDMVKVYFYATMMDEIGCEEPERGMDTEIYIGTEHTSADSIIRDATEFEIKFLLSYYADTISGLTIKKVKVKTSEDFTKELDELNESYEAFEKEVCDTLEKYIESHYNLIINPEYLHESGRPMLISDLYRTGGYRGMPLGSVISNIRKFEVMLKNPEYWVTTKE
jgi:hypothetical protein